LGRITDTEVGEKIYDMILYDMIRYIC